MLPDNTPEQRLANKFLKMTTKQFNEWAEKSTLEEVTRVTQAIQIANQQLRDAIDCLEYDLEYEIEEELEFSDLYDAKTVLSPYTLNGIK